MVDESGCTLLVEALRSDLEVDETDSASPLVRVSGKTHAILKQASKATGFSMGQIIEAALTQYMNGKEIR